MNPTQTGNKSSEKMFRYLVAATLIATATALTGCAALGLGDRSPEPPAEQLAAEQRAGQLAEALPADTRVVLQLRPDALDTIGDVQLEGWLPAVEDRDEFVERIAQIADDDGVVVAVTTAENDDYVERGWVQAPVADPEELPEGLHLRILVSSPDLSDSAREFQSLCSAGAADRPVCLADIEGQHLTVDYLAHAHEDAAGDFVERLDDADLGIGDGQIFDRHTPALQQFLTSESMLSVYWREAGILEPRLVAEAASQRSVFDDAPPHQRPEMLLRSQSFMFADLLASFETAEFEDFAITADWNNAPRGDDSTESPQFQFQLDLIRTYTELGQRLWADQGTGSDADDGWKMEAPNGKFILHSPVDRVVRGASAPSWAEGDRNAVSRWIAERRHRSLEHRFFPLLQYPGGLLHMGLDRDDLDQFQQELSDGLDVTFTDDVDVDSSVNWTTRIDLADYQVHAAGHDQDTQVHAAGHDQDTHEWIRARSGTEPEPPERMAFDSSQFELLEPTRHFHDCAAVSRMEFLDGLMALEVATPEQRADVLEISLQNVIDQLRECEEEFPDQAHRFRSARGAWSSWLASSTAAGFDVAMTRRHLEEACRLGEKSACAERERLENVEEFTLPPVDESGAFFGFLPELSSDVDDVWLMTDRGVYDDAQLIVDADELRESPGEVTDRLADHAPGDGELVEIAADTTTDADVVTALAEQLQAAGHATGLVVALTSLESASRNFPASGVATFNDGEMPDSPDLHIHIGAEGIALTAFGQRVKPLGGCPDDAPTICTDPGTDVAELIGEATDHWNDQNVEQGLEQLEQAIEAYRLHEIYNALYKISQYFPDHSTLHVTADDRLPVAVPVRIASVLVYERSEAQFDDLHQLLEADYEIAPESDDRPFMPLFDQFTLSRADSVPLPGDDPDAAPLDAVLGGEADLPVDSEPPTGHLDREIIRRVVRQHRAGIANCYERQLQIDPDLEGRVDAQWTIGMDGEVMRATIEDSTLDNAEVEDCIARQIESWTFPEPDGGIVRVNYPFNFSH